MIQMLKRQHKEIWGLLNQIEAILTKDFSGNSFEILMKLGELSGKVKMHLAQEDQVLYPALLENKEPKVRETAQKFIQEMGGLSQAFNKFRAKYASVNSIKENPVQFAAEMKAVANTLYKRIRAEEQDLYPLIAG